ncbi:MAG TPA: DUF4142 domain-containing protein [Chryseolinea sp.]
MDNEKRIMLAIAVYAAIMVMIFHSVAVNAQLDRRNALALSGNSDISLVEEEVSDFLIKSAGARMLNAQEGLLATERGGNTSVRQYGELMMKDHSMLLQKIKVLASERNVSLPNGISGRNAGDHQSLSEERGHEFDEKFVKMLIIDYEKDVKLFKKATQFNDIEVSSFAQHYLPLIQSHLVKIKNIKSNLNAQ